MENNLIDLKKECKKIDKEIKNSIINLSEVFLKFSDKLEKSLGDNFKSIVK